MTIANDPINVADYVNNDGTIQRHEYKGLSKREYFAAMAMQGIVSNQAFLLNLNAEPKMVCEAIIEIADELINALNQSEK